MENDQIIKILTKIIQKNDINENERELIQQWKSKSHVNQQLYTYLTTPFSIDNLPENYIRYQDIFRKIERNIMKSEQNISDTKSKSIIRTINWRGMWKYTAVFLIGIAATLMNIHLQEVQELSTAWSEVKVPKGAIAEVLLPDSSIVTLNSQSCITYSPQFMKGNREVKLEGEAYFKVNKQLNGNPFRVHTKGTQIIVKGTEFNLRAYPTDETVEATLLKGSIVFSAEQQQITLKPEQHLSYETKSKAINIQHANSDRIGWLNGEYNFNDTSLKDIGKMLSRMYNITIVVEPEIQEIVFSGNINRHNPLTHTLEVISLTTGVKFHIQQNTVYFRPSLQPKRKQ